MDKITYNNQVFEGKIIPDSYTGKTAVFQVQDFEQTNNYDNCLKGLYRQGYTGKVVNTWVLRLELTQSGKWAIAHKFVNSSRQAKDPYAYLIGIAE